MPLVTHKLVYELRACSDVARTRYKQTALSAFETAYYVFLFVFSYTLKLSGISTVPSQKMVV